MLCVRPMEAIGQTDISVIESKLFISSSRESIKGNNLCYLRRYFCVGYIHICFYWTHGSTIDSPKNLNLTSNILQLTIFAFLLQFYRENDALHEKDKKYVTDRKKWITMKIIEKKKTREEMHLN